MIRLHVIAEGQTEETFVRDVLAPHLARYTVYTDVRCLDSSRRRGSTIPFTQVNTGKLFGE